MGAMPLLPFRIAFQVSSVPTPTGLIRPTPVTTTDRDRFELDSLGIYILSWSQTVNVEAGNEQKGRSRPAAHVGD